MYRGLVGAYTNTTTVLRPFFRDHPGEPAPEENFWTLWCKGRLTEADTQTIRLGATPSGLTSNHIFTGRMPFLPPRPSQQCTAWIDNIKSWTAVEESIRMTEDRDKWRNYVHGVANTRIEDG